MSWAPELLQGAHRSVYFTVKRLCDQKQRSSPDELRGSSKGNLRPSFRFSVLKLALLSELGGLTGDKTAILRSPPNELSPLRSHQTSILLTALSLARRRKASYSSLGAPRYPRYHQRAQ